MAVVLANATEPPQYQRIAHEALHLHELSLNHTAIAERLQVTDKTVAKAIRWTMRGRE